MSGYELSLSEYLLSWWQILFSFSFLFSLLFFFPVEGTQYSINNLKPVFSFFIFIHAQGSLRRYGS